MGETLKVLGTALIDFPSRTTSLTISCWFGCIFRPSEGDAARVGGKSAGVCSAYPGFTRHPKQAVDKIAPA